MHFHVLAELPYVSHGYRPWRKVPLPEEAVVTAMESNLAVTTVMAKGDASRRTSMAFVGRRRPNPRMCIPTWLWLEGRGRILAGESMPPPSLPAHRWRRGAPRRAT
jgi:hypothetical protein